jgi:cytosolic carboxypeptidase protein 2/3
MNFLQPIQENKNYKDFFSMRTLTKTIANNCCEYCVITSSSGKKRKERHGVVIIGRQHPGETMGSWVMQGVIEFLLSDDPMAVYLRKQIVFKIIPMMNPDGVIHGHYRTSLSGSDLNRRWKCVNKVPPHPLTPAPLPNPLRHEKARQTIRQRAQDRVHLRPPRAQQKVTPILPLISRFNSFMYGCKDKNDPIKSRVFPLLYSKQSKYFSFEDCRFNMQKSKEATARIQLFKEILDPVVFTLETSFCGYHPDRGNKQFMRQHSE